MLTVNDLMTAVPSSVTPETTLRTIIGIMKAGGYRQIPVLKNGRLVGIITDRDIRLVMNSPMVLHNRSVDADLLNQVTVESCMTPNPVTVTPDTPAYQAAEMLSMYKFGALPVLEEDALVGIITVSDFLDYFTRSHGGQVEEDE
jgi:acetoin utilization protein AcuB